MLTITLTDLIIKSLVIDYERQAVIVRYSIIDSSGKSWLDDEATFFVTMPPQNPIYNELGEIIGYEPYPVNWFVLPANYIPILLALKNDADTALTTRFGI